VTRHLMLACLPILVIATATATSAEPTCRRFLPATGVVVQVPCVESASLNAPATPVAAPSAKATEKVTSPAAVTVSAPAKQVAVAATGGNNMKTCVEILERAQLGKLLDGDIALLREKCRAMN